MHTDKLGILLNHVKFYLGAPNHTQIRGSSLKSFNIKSLRGIRHSAFFRVFGPAWLVMMADMDASCVIEAAQTGAQFGYGFIWMMALLIMPLYIVQELAGRISIATRKGLGTVIRENYSTVWSGIMTVPMAVTDVITYGIEYIGIAVGLEILA